MKNIFFSFAFFITSICFANEGGGSKCQSPCAAEPIYASSSSFTLQSAEEAFKIATAPSTSVEKGFWELVGMAGVPGNPEFMGNYYDEKKVLNPKTGLYFWPAGNFQNEFDLKTHYADAAISITRGLYDLKLLPAQVYKLDSSGLIFLDLEDRSYSLKKSCRVPSGMNQKMICSVTVQESDEPSTWVGQIIG